MTPDRDAWARSILLSVAPNGSSKGPYLGWYQAAQSVMRHETGYGGWKGAGAGSNNMGAVQSKSNSDPCPPGTFTSDDSHPDGTKYHACFMSYPTPEDGMLGFLKVFLRGPVRAVLDNPDDDGNVSSDAVAQAMHDQGYFEGFCPGATSEGFTRKSPECHAEAIRGYANILARNARELAHNLGEDLSIFPVESLPAASSAPVDAPAGETSSGGFFARVLFTAGASYLLYRIVRGSS